MRYIIFCCFFILSTTAFSQVIINKKDINNRAVNYVEVWEKYNKETEKFFAMVDYGQLDDKKDSEGVNLKMTNDQGQYLEFNGIIDIINYMARNGWEVLHVKTIDKYESYVMKRKSNLMTPQLSTTSE